MAFERRLFVVDDEPDYCDIICSVGQELGYDTAFSTSVENFRASYPDFCPTVIFMDLIMPDADGIEALQWLASMKCAADIYAMTGFSPFYAETAQSVGKAFNLKVNSLTKPIRLSKLREILTS